MKAIECKQVSKQFDDVVALKSVSFQLESGKIYALLGRNGAGKPRFLTVYAPSIYRIPEKYLYWKKKRMKTKRY